MALIIAILEIEAIKANTATGITSICFRARNPAKGRLSFCLFRENFLIFIILINH